MHTQEKLMDQLAAPENLLTAWRAVRGNIPRYRRERSAGPDGVTLAEFERDLPVQLSSLRHMLLKGRYQPQPPGLFTIEKRSGGTRQIALLNISDRVAQRAAQQVIEPLYEPAFLPCSFGFRPGRSIQDAVYCASRLRQHGYAWVVDGDIAACFDSLDHRLLMQQVGKRICDDRVLELVHKWLGIGILNPGLPTPQPGWLEQGWHKTSRGVRKGMDWALNTVFQPEQPDPYYGARYEHPAYPPTDYQSSDFEAGEAEEAEENDASFYSQYDEEDVRRKAVQQRAVQQMTTGGLLLGTSWARRALAKAGPAAIAALKTQAGQEVLKRGLMIGGGALGAAAGVAVSAYFVYRRVAPPSVGVLQGSPLSPLLANIYLHSFDVSLTRAGFRLVRYADDWVILCPDQSAAESAYNRATISLARLHLKVNQEKTHILTPSDRLEWLGEVIS